MLGVFLSRLRSSFSEKKLSRYEQTLDFYIQQAGALSLEKLRAESQRWRHDLEALDRRRSQARVEQFSKIVAIFEQELGKREGCDTDSGLALDLLGLEGSRFRLNKSFYRDPGWVGVSGAPLPEAG